MLLFKINVFFGHLLYNIHINFFIIFNKILGLFKLKEFKVFLS